MGKISVVDFILKSTQEEPKRATYGRYTLVSHGKRGNRFMTIMDGAVEIGNFWVDTRCDGYACFIHSVRGSDIDKPMRALRLGMSTYGWYDGWFWAFKTWAQVEALILDIIDSMKTAK